MLRGQRLRVFLQTLPLLDITMRIHATKPLFAWDELETSPTLATIREALETIPDAPLLHALQQRRHNGCDTYPVTVLWGVLLLSIILRHTAITDCLEELRRNAALRLLIGIENEDQVPHGWNLTRFLAVLGEAPYLKLLRDAFDHMVKRLGIGVERQKSASGARSGCKADILEVIRGAAIPLTRKEVLKSLRTLKKTHGPGTVAKALADLTSSGALVNTGDKKGYRMPEWVRKRETPSLFG